MNLGFCRTIKHKHWHNEIGMHYAAVRTVHIQCMFTSLKKNRCSCCSYCSNAFCINITYISHILILTQFWKKIVLYLPVLTNSKQLEGTLLSPTVKLNSYQILGQSAYIHTLTKTHPHAIPSRSTDAREGNSFLSGKYEILNVSLRLVSHPAPSICRRCLHYSSLSSTTHQSE